MSSQSDESIKTKAADLRQRLGLEGQYAPNLVEVLQKLASFNPRIRMVLVPDPKLPLVEARAEPNTRTIYLRQSVFDDLKRADPRARWTVAHEIGHVILKHKGVNFRATGKSFVVAVEKHQEREAQIFAAEFLAPTNLIARYRSTDEITQRFHVTPEVAKIRLETLSRSTDGGPLEALDSSSSELTTFSLEHLPPSPDFRAHAAALSSLTEHGYTESEIFKFVAPKRTLARRRAANELLTTDETDRALRLKRIASQAKKVFGNPDKASRWLRKPKRELKGETPLAYLASEVGARVVEEMLHRIEYGIFA